MEPFGRRGVALGITLLIVAILTVTLFAYDLFSRRQRERLVHGNLADVVSIMARNGLDFASRALESANLETGRLLRESAAPQLFSTEDVPSVDLATGTCYSDGTPLDEGDLLDRIAGDWQKCLNEYTDPAARGGNETGFPSHPICDEIGVAARNIFKIRPNPDATDFIAGWDPVEKHGEIQICCRVTFRGISRVALACKQFKIVSMIPGPYCRFTLFNQTLPNAHSLNVVKNQYDGSFDDRGEASPRPLVLLNGPEQALSFPLPSPTQSGNREELMRNGWVYLGVSPGGTGSRQPENLDGGVVLRLPSGFLPRSGDPPIWSVSPGDPRFRGLGIGGHIFLTLPIRLGNGKLGVFPYSVVPSGVFDPQACGGQWSVKAHFQGFYTQDSGNNDPNNEGAAGLKFWNSTRGPLRLEECTSSWILPYGIRGTLSRTLAVGPAFTEFLEFFTLEGASFKGILLPPKKGETGFDPNDPVECSTGNAPGLTYKDLFIPHSEDPAGKTGLCSLKSVCPRVWESVLEVGRNHGIALNLLFDMMQYNELPDLESSRSRLPWGIGQLPALSQWIPGNNSQTPLNEMESTSPSGHPGMQPLSNFHLWRFHDPPACGIEACEKTVFLGDLRKLYFRNRTGSLPPFDDVVSKGLLKRVTHLIDLRGKSDAEVTGLLGREVFTVRSSPGGRKTFLWNRPGIVLLRRDPRDGDVRIPFPIEFGQPGILILEHGDLCLDGSVTELPGGAPQEADGMARNPFSLVALDGNLRIPPEKLVQAYLVALNGSLSKDSGRGGRLLASSGGGGPNSNRMRIEGGLAVFEMAGETDSTLQDFRFGGMIRFNPRFNPCGEKASENYRLVIDSQAERVLIGGGE